MDGLLITWDDWGMNQETKACLQSSFKIKDLGELAFFLGIEFARNQTWIVMHQRKYALNLIFDLGLAGAKLVGSPLELYLKLTSADLDCLTLPYKS